MPARFDAEESIEVIRRLMERGQTYEAITARGALRSGLAAIAVAAAVHFAGDHAASTFALSFLALALAAALWVAAAALRRRDGDGGLSAQARHVGRALAPAAVSAAVLTVVFWRAGLVDELPGVWMLLHGVAVLATGHHAPARLVRLGAAFLAAGTVFALVPVERCLAMAVGFGLLLVAYGATARRGPAAE